MMKKEKRLLARFAMLVLPKHAVLCPASDASKQEKKSEILKTSLSACVSISHTHKSTDSRVVVYVEKMVESRAVNLKLRKCLLVRC